MLQMYFCYKWSRYAQQKSLGYSTITLPVGIAALSFANSSANPWASPGLLTIEGWNGSMAGGGIHQISFGSNSTGLTPAQLAQIRFHNPAGSIGYYPATILNPGEIVPSRFLASAQDSNHLQISWAPGMILQSSTNANGPYFDVTGATSPYTTIFSGPQRFFRLRQ